ncbi:coiled-coil domain-containing protein 181-like [Lytechinus variegatus]|uniref:coiled-coil domain-containing protein 181-like n=1 Tax=Lytechinus variegatus TaxID=7654 RepID=UPI001BB0F84C|nr:coiled-coil domain-containing protein 181-like [Lytechinus variegatus]
MEENGEERTMTPSIPESNDDATNEISQPGEPQTEEELERLIDKELEDVGKDESESPDEKEKRLDAQQREIDEELRKLREELEMDSTSPDDMGPEYDIAARVKQLNEELAKEGPIQEKKNRKVNFPENVISMAVPPEEYPEEKKDCEGEKEGESKADGQSVPVNDDGSDTPQAVREGWGTPENGTNRDAVAEQKQENAEAEKHIGSSSGQEDIELVSPSPSESLPNRTEGDSGKPSDTNTGVTEQSKVIDPPVAQHPVVNRHESLEDGATPQDNQKDTLPYDAPDGTVNSSDSGGVHVSSSSDPNDLEVERLTFRPQVQNNRLVGQNNRQGEEMNATKGEGEEEFVLVERGGKFYHVHVNDLSPEERQFLGLQESPRQSDSNSQLPAVQPRPPQKPRPATATGGGARVGNQKPSPRRAMSAKTQKEYDRQDRHGAIYEEPFGNARSRYGMTPEQKEFRREQARLKMQRMREEKEREEQEKREKEELSESIFKAWVEKKKEEIAQQKKEERDRKRAELENKEERFPEEAFKAWLERKKNQKRAESNVKQQLSEEQKQAYFMRSREDCERAFREWKKSKNASLREARSMSRAEALETKKRARQSRKSRNLAKALEVAQNYRYTEYYGYRF